MYFDERILLITTLGGKRWQLPKGHIEHGESPAQAAIREVQEETGVQSRVVGRLGTLDYDYANRSGKRVHKTVDYFLCSYVAGSVDDFDPSEVSGAAWLQWHDGIERLSFDNERRLAADARELWEFRRRS